MYRQVGSHPPSHVFLNWFSDDSEKWILKFNMYTYIAEWNIIGFLPDSKKEKKSKVNKAPGFP